MESIYQAFQNGKLIFLPKAVPLKATDRNSHSEVFLRKSVLKICSKFTREHPCRSANSIKLLEIALRHGCSPVNLLHICRTPFLRNTSGWLLLHGVVFDPLTWRFYKSRPSNKKQWKNNLQSDLANLPLFSSSSILYEYFLGSVIS